jgi:hypothetical protein
MNPQDYFDLTVPENDIELLTINQVDHFNCNLINSSTGEVYRGFVLARSPEGNRLTVCDVDFQRSDTDNKYQPRLTFRRVNREFNDVSAPSSSRHVRMPFAGGEDGYREFWKMIFFLYKFKETVDFGDFDGSYQLISSEQLREYMNNAANKDEIIKIADELGVDVSEILRTKSTLTLLKNYRQKLQEFIDNEASETDVQNWIDEDGHKYRQQRCLIFGLEYIDFKREGSVNSKNFDVLTRVGSKYIDHVIIELKGPSADIFEVTSSDTVNNPTDTYKLHGDLARAIPQILEYKSSLESKEPGDAELEKLGIFDKPHIGKCIVVIGKHSDNPRWLKNRENLVRSLNSGLEIWTYTELLNKLDATIQNLERIREDEDEDESEEENPENT